MAKTLAEKRCIPCEGGVPRLHAKEIEPLVAELGHDWKVVEERKLEKEFSFPNFRKALDFTLAIGEIAEEEDHHPDIHLSWGKVKLIIWTHKINGLTESDFILAAKCQQKYQPKTIDPKHPPAM